MNVAIAVTLCDLFRHLVDLGSGWRFSAANQANGFRGYVIDCVGYGYVIGCATHQQLNDTRRGKAKITLLDSEFDFGFRVFSFDFRVLLLCFEQRVALRGQTFEDGCPLNEKITSKQGG